MRHRQLTLFTIATILAGPALNSLSRAEPANSPALTLLSDPYRLDKIYRSMQGPWSVQREIHLGPSNPSPVTNPVFAVRNSSIEWITGLEAQVVDAGEQTLISQEFFCHSNLTFAEHGASPDRYNAQLGKTHLDWRLFTLVPGRTSIELPPGFGVPVPADAPLDYVTMSLNLNERSNVVNVRMRTTLHTIAADQPGAPTKALFRRAFYVLQPHAESADIMAPACLAKPGQHIGAGCAEMSKVNLPEAPAAAKPGEPPTNHWIVPPGRHTYSTEITPQLNLPFDTTIHYATIHVHPFARGMELRDLTTGQTILRLHSQDLPDRVGVAQVEEFKSSQGLPISRSHRYQLTVEYDNTSDSNTDAMAILYLYLFEKDFT